MSVTWFTSDDQRVSTGSYFEIVVFATTRAHALAAQAEVREHMAAVSKTDGPRALPAPRVLGGVTYGYGAIVRGRPDGDWQARTLEGQLRHVLRTPRIEVRIGRVGTLDALWDVNEEYIYGAEAPVRRAAGRVADAGGQLAEAGLDGLEGATDLVGSTAEGLGATGSIFKFLGPLGGLILVGVISFVGYKVLTRRGVL